MCILVLWCCLRFCLFTLQPHSKQYFSFFFLKIMLLFCWFYNILSYVNVTSLYWCHNMLSYILVFFLCSFLGILSYVLVIFLYCHQNILSYILVYFHYWCHNIMYSILLLLSRYSFIYSWFFSFLRSKCSLHINICFQFQHIFNFFLFRFPFNKTLIITYFYHMPVFQPQFSRILT